MGYKDQVRNINLKMKLLFSLAIFSFSQARPARNRFQKQTTSEMTSATTEMTTTTEFDQGSDPDWTPDPATTDMTSTEYSTTDHPPTTDTVEKVTSTTEELTTTTWFPQESTTDGEWLPKDTTEDTTRATSTSTYAQTLYSLFEDDYSH